MKLRTSITNNPKTSIIAIIILILGVFNDVITEYGNAIGLTDRTITIITAVILTLTLVYNELKERGIIKSLKDKARNFIKS